MTAFVITLGFVGWVAFLGCVVALFRGSSVPTPGPIPTREQVIWDRAVTKLAGRRRAS